jgi:hypothetical protein
VVRHVVTGGLLALKVLHDARDPVQRERLLREARVAARLRSEHVVRVTDAGTLESGEPYLVMELLAGRDLESRLARDGPLAPATAVSYVLQVCDALTEAHALGLVHRDIKPANLFLTRRDDGRVVVKVLDFGIATPGFADGGAPRITDTGAVLGSPQFMAPEQLVSSRDVDARADIWSLGATLFDLLSAEVPFEGADVAQVLGAIVREPPRALAPLCRELPDGLERVVMRCLEKDPEERYATVGELAAALAPFGPPKRNALAVATTEPDVEAPAPAATEPATPPPRRRPRWPYGVLAALGAGAVVLVFGLAAPTAQTEPVTLTAAPPERLTRRGRPVYTMPGKDLLLSPEERAEIRAAIDGANAALMANHHAAALERAAWAEASIARRFVRGSEPSMFGWEAASVTGNVNLSWMDHDPRRREDHFRAALDAYMRAAEWDWRGVMCPQLLVVSLEEARAQHLEQELRHEAVAAARDEALARVDSYLEGELDRRCLSLLSTERAQLLETR